MKPIRWGILGCGKIANKFAADLRLVDGAVLHAAASTDPGRARAFAAAHGFTHAFGSYFELCASDVDVIYVATPHGLHHEHVRLCLQHGKAVLCEKAFTLNSCQLDDLIGLARERKVFLMEAFWTRFIPQFLRMRQVVDAGTIGEIKMISADFGFKAPVPAAPRLYEPSLGGGALLDIGIYPVFLALSLLGRPESVSAAMTSYPTGVDEQIAMSLQFPSGAMASLHASFAADTPVEARINGTLGRIVLTPRFHNPTSSSVILELPGQEPQLLIGPSGHGGGYQYEARHVQECLAAGLTESPLLPLDFSRQLMETLDRLRASCGIRYPADQY